MELCQLVVCARHVSGRICDKLVPSVTSQVSTEGWNQEWQDDFSCFMLLSVLNFVRGIICLIFFKLLKGLIFFNKIHLIDNIL